MYAYKLSRSCRNENNRLPLPPDNCQRLTIDPNTILDLWIRMYLEPATKVGPSYAEILYDRVSKFSPRSP